MKVALVYDRVNKWGGAERVLLALHKIYPDAPLYTSVYDKSSSLWAKQFKVKTSFLQKAKPLRGYNDKLPVFMPSAFESFNFDEYDLVISVTSEAAKGIITKPGTIHICYCLTPTRYLWSGYSDYFRSALFRFVSVPAVSYLRLWDIAAASRPDYFIAISQEVKGRIKKYYGRDSQIIFPPIMIKEFKKNISDEKNDFFLLVSRFSRSSYYKRVDLAVEVFNKTGMPLKIVGSGPMLKHVQKKIKGNIELLGELTDEDLAYYYKNCRALIFPGLEDFGLAMAEAQSFGKPVIAYKAGGAIDIVEEGKTGELFEKQTVDSFIKALKKFEQKRYNKAAIVSSSCRFSFEVFKSDFTKFVEDKI